MTVPAALDTSYMRAVSLCGFAEFVTARDGDPVEMLERAGIDPKALNSPDMLVSFARTGALLESAARELGIASFGLEWALDIAPHFPNAGPMLLIREGVATLGQWLERSIRYWQVQTNAIELRLVIREDDGTVALRLVQGGEQSAPRQQMEHIAGKILRVMQAVPLEGAVNPVRIRFRHARPADTSAHDLLFRCPVEFGAGHDELLFPSGVLELPTDLRSQELEAVAQAFLRHRIGLLPRYTPGVSTSIALAIRTMLGAGICSKEFIARALNSSPRKLQRLLAREGTTYEEVLDAVRKDLACRFLAEGTAPISAIAGMLDFASPVALTLAMRRWTGKTPSDYRADTRLVPEDMPVA